MIYITKEDLENDSHDRFIDESTGFDDKILDKIEEKVISLCKTFLTRYDTDDVFDPVEPIIDEHLVDIMAKIMLYRVFGRNAARKRTNDVKENYEWAMLQLEKIQTGRITLNLPPRVDEIVEPTGPILYGNFSNPDFYI